MTIPFSLTNYLPLILVLASFGLILALCTEQTQVIAKMRGAQSGNIASGYSTAMKIMMLNRLGTIFYMFFLGLAIDLGLENNTLLAVTITAALGTLLYNVFLLVRRRQLLNFHQSIKDGPEVLKDFLTAFGPRITLASYVATLLNILGLTLPLLLSNSFPQYRLSLANTGFLLNTFFTLINVLILESRIASILDQGAKEESYTFATMIFITRLFALFSAAVIFACLMFFI